MFLTEKDIEMIMRPFGVSSEDKVARYPLTDIGVREDNSLIVQIACAGFSRDDLDIETKNNQLIVSGRYSKPIDGVDWYQKHISDMDFERVLVLHDKYVNGNVTATYDDGILYIAIVPKEEDRKIITIS